MKPSTFKKTLSNCAPNAWEKTNLVSRIYKPVYTNLWEATFIFLFVAMLFLFPIIITNVTIACLWSCFSKWPSIVFCCVGCDEPKHICSVRNAFLSLHIWIQIVAVSHLISHLPLHVLVQQLTVAARGCSRCIPYFIKHPLASKCLGIPAYTTGSYSNSARCWEWKMRRDEGTWQG